MYYNAADQLAVDARIGSAPGWENNLHFLLTLDTYRYDALGRRVFGMRLRFWKIGFCFGLFIAAAFAVWLSLSKPSPYDSEGAAFTALGAATALGFPVSLPFSLVLEWLGPAMQYIPGVNVLHGMLVGIVLNWTVIGLAADILRSKGHSNNDRRPPD